MTEPQSDIQDRLLEAIKIHVSFDGWSDTAFKMACSDIGVDESHARVFCPRGALDLAVAYHKAGDAGMIARLHAADLSALKFRDRITAGVRYRLEAVEDKELVQRGTTLFALPMNAAEGARLVWGTCDAIWTTLGDTSDDYNWYSKRATLSAVYSATVLYWLGDTSEDHQDTWDFLDRRIENVMQFEKYKGQMANNKALNAVFAGPKWILSQIKAPQDLPFGRYPGQRGQK